MADIETAGRIGRISKVARELLTGTARPITLLPALPGVLAPGIGPDTDATGVMPGEGLIIKRVVRDLEKQRLLLLSDNPSHQSQSLPLEDPGVAVLGKAIWVIQEI